MRAEKEGNPMSSPEWGVAERPKVTTTSVAAWCQGCSQGQSSLQLRSIVCGGIGLGITDGSSRLLHLNEYMC
jgi:hypothetical protein